MQRTLRRLKSKFTPDDELPMRQIISNIGTATYKTAKYLSKLLASLGKSDYTVINNVDFLSKLKTKQCPRNYKMVYKMDLTIDIILSKVDVEKLITTKLSRNELNQLLELCTKQVPFTFNEKYYLQAGLQWAPH